MKILHVETGENLYGGPVQVLYLLQALQGQTDFEHQLLAPPGSGLAVAAKAKGFHVHEVPCKGDLDFGLIGRIRKVIRNQGIDLVHLHSRRGADIMGGLAAALEKEPCLLSRRVDNPEKPWVVKLKYRLYDHVVCISDGIVRVLESEGLPRSKMSLIIDAVDTDAYQIAPDPDWFRHEFGLPADAPVVGMIAQLIHRKGHDLLIDAFPQVLKQVPKAHALLFGKGPLEEKLTEQIRRLGLQDRISLVGFRDDLPRVIPNLTLLAHPARAEGLGVSLLQCISSGVPVVATAVGGIPEVVHTGKTGVLLPANITSSDLGAALVEALQKNWSPEWKQAARHWCIQNHGLPAMGEAYVRVYKNLLSI